MLQRTALVFLAVLGLCTIANAQRTQITINLDEQFFDAVLDALFNSGAPPEFSLAANRNVLPQVPGGMPHDAGLGSNTPAGACTESIKLLRENNGVRSAVRFRDGKIHAPLAFTGNYNPPLVGCVAFSGVAESTIDLEFEPAEQRLVARVRVHNVALNGTGGVGGAVIARLVQSSIDRRINPVEIIKLDKISFVVPIQNSANLKMQAVGFRHDVGPGQLYLHIAYEFQKL